MRKISAELHVHTRYSLDSLSEPQEILDAAMKKGLDTIAITDHNSVEGAFEVERIAREKKLPMQVIIGEEVMCDEGDLLVYFVKKKIEPGPLARVLKEVNKQGAICCAAHPYDKTRTGIELEKLPSQILGKIDAIETFNARATVGGNNALAEKFADKHGKKKFAGSDAHHPSEIGTAIVEFEGVGELTPKNMLTAKSKIHAKLSPTYVRFYSRWAVLQKRIFGRK